MTPFELKAKLAKLHRKIDSTFDTMAQRQASEIQALIAYRALHDLRVEINRLENDLILDDAKEAGK